MLLGAARRAARCCGAGLRPGVGGGREGGSARARPDRPPQPLAPSLLPGRVARNRLDLLARPVRGLSGRRRRAAGRQCRFAPARRRRVGAGGGQERPPVGAGAWGSSSRGLAKGTYVRGGACVAALGAHVAPAGPRRDPGSHVNSFAREQVCGRHR